MSQEERPRFTRPTSLASLSCFGFDDATMTIDDVSQIMTPKSKRMTPSLPVLDEDSGLGMEIDNIKPSCIHFDTPETSCEANDSFGELVRPFAALSSEKEKKDACRQLFGARKRHLLTDDMTTSSKRRRETCSPRKSLMKKSLSFGSSPLSETDDDLVAKTIDRFVQGSNLIGDGSSSFSLPTIPGKHSDLTSITSHTVSDILLGRYDDVIGSYQIVDCRYPYEYEGGHIKTAVNIHWRQENRTEELLHSRDYALGDGKRHIIIFYCEFSSERGPKMCRNFRRRDRALNKDKYPSLNFPEIYILHDGYRGFYHSHQELCDPRGYTPMLHKDHSADLRHFRSKSKSWSNGDKSRKRAQLMF